MREPVELVEPREGVGDLGAVRESRERADSADRVLPMATELGVFRSRDGEAMVAPFVGVAGAAGSGSISAAGAPTSPRPTMLAPGDAAGYWA